MTTTTITTTTTTTKTATTTRAAASPSPADESATTTARSALRRSTSGGHVWTATLLALAVLVCVLWWRSRTRVDALTLFVAGDGRAQVLASSGGRVCIALTNIRFGRERAWTAICDSTPGDLPAIVSQGLDVTRLQIYPPADPAKVAAGASPFGEGYLGFTFASSQTAVLPELPNSQLVYALIPHWAVALPLLAWSLWRLFGPAAERHRRLRKGQCVRCGYDLRASSGRCPECGAEIHEGSRQIGARDPEEVAS